MAQVRRLLLVDDDEDLRSSLAEQLMLHEEFTILQAATGAEAVTVARSQSPDLILLDVGLPDMDGREAVKLLRRGGDGHPPPLVAGPTSCPRTRLPRGTGRDRPLIQAF